MGRGWDFVRDLGGKWGVGWKMNPFTVKRDTRNSATVF